MGITRTGLKMGKLFATVSVIAGLAGIGEHSEKKVQTVTTSLVWKFNWGGPVVAKY